MRLRATLFPFLSTFALTAACGSDVIVHQGNDAAGGDSGTTTTTGPTLPVPKPTMTVRAPTQYSIEVTFNAAPPAAALIASSYTLSGEHGGVQVQSLRQEGNTVVILQTSKQKLGVVFDITLNAGGDWQGLTDSFPSADTAKFWAADLSDPQFAEYELVANRQTIGEHVVIYVEQGYAAQNLVEAERYFDDEVFPTETQLFNPAPDQDDNDRVLLLGLDGNGAYGGYFSSVNTLTNEEALDLWGVHSNETDMLYINVESGELSDHVVAHEFSHMLYDVSHTDDGQDWAWHNEGMAECAVHAVNGHNNDDVWYYSEDPQGGIQTGLSIINWQYANFDQYVLAYMFLSYVAGQKDGASTFGELFALDGSPASFNTWLQQELGVSFAEAQRSQLLATWVQASSGVHSYNGMATFFGPPPIGSGSLSLEPFGGAFRQPASPFNPPGTQGPDIVYVGINGLGAVDETEPFDVDGGALLVFNTSTNANNFTPQPTGNPMPQVPKNNVVTQEAAELTRALTWRHPPPFNPKRLDALRQWQRVVHRR